MVFQVVILDQNGNAMMDQDVTFITPTNSLTKTITEDTYSGPYAYGLRFRYGVRSTSTIETITVKSDGFSQSAEIKVGHRLAELPLDHFSVVSDTKWVEKSSGLDVDPETMTCINNQTVLE